MPLPNESHQRTLFGVLRSINRKRELSTKGYFSAVKKRERLGQGNSLVMKERTIAKFQTPATRFSEHIFVSRLVTCEEHRSSGAHCHVLDVPALGCVELHREHESEQLGVRAVGVSMVRVRTVRASHSESQPP